MSTTHRTTSQTTASIPKVLPDMRKKTPRMRDHTIDELNNEAKTSKFYCPMLRTLLGQLTRAATMVTTAPTIATTRSTMLTNGSGILMKPDGVVMLMLGMRVFPYNDPSWRRGVETA